MSLGAKLGVPEHYKLQCSQRSLMNFIRLLKELVMHKQRLGGLGMIKNRECRVFNNKQKVFSALCATFAVDVDVCLFPYL